MRPGDVILPECTTSYPTQDNIGSSNDSYDWELLWLSENTSVDGINYSNDLERELRQLPDIWASEPHAAESQIFEQAILQGFTYDKSCLSSGNINGDIPRPCEPVENGLGSPRISPLHTASKRGHVKIVRLLLEHDADCDIQDDDGRTPLIHAMVGGHEEVAGLLLSYGASVQIADHQSRSALHWAVMGRHDRLLNMLLKHCVGNKMVVDGLTRDGRTPLHIAVETDFETGVELLLQSGADA
ncbi:hypothetical protein MMC27_008699 [Xylographa pallens]|nr:hypothetical protein [Xylographa pallens]